ncbi:MAG: Xaa-Pro peptidase family protein [Candidatus Nanopelagicales bacterium]
MNSTPGDFGSRLTRAVSATVESGLSGLLISPGPDLQYLIGYDAVPLERITCLVICANASTVLVVPRLELLAAQASPAGSLGINIVTWDESDDPYALIGDQLPHDDSRAYGVDDHMWASKVLQLRAAIPDRDQTLAGPVLQPLRMTKDAAEIEALIEAGAAIDRVHAAIPHLLKIGMTEKEAAAAIGAQILAEGHVRVDFVIVAAGPNGASPHHEPSDYHLAVGEPIVIDIGGTMPSGYRSDCTRMYSLGEPDQDFQLSYAALLEAQAATVRAVKPGVTTGRLDVIPREILAEHGLSDYFIHRTGHGIGLETHEDPYLMAGSELVVEPGMAFSIEPGFYLAGRYGARIEDIVVCTTEGVRSLNNQPHELIVVEVP